MKRTRKGFTLVELLIVVAILGALAAVMTVSSGSSIAKAKATALANNLRVCTAGAQIYYLDHADDGTTNLSTITTKAMLNAQVPNFADFGDGNVKYESEDISGATPPESWGVKITLSGVEAEPIATALHNIKGFSGVTSTTKSFTYKVFEGTI